jgi:hypothetical protein
MRGKDRVRKRRRVVGRKDRKRRWKRRRRKRSKRKYRSAKLAKFLAPLSMQVRIL